MTVPRFCLDVDLLRYEPDLFASLHLCNQVKAAGAAGVIAATAFTDAAADFGAAQAAAGDVVYLEGSAPLAGSFEVTEVVSDTALTVSVLRAEPTDEIIAPPPSAAAITWRIATFAPQIVDVSFALCELFRLAPGDPSTGITPADLVSDEPLRRTCALGVLARVYRIWAGRPSGETWRAKAEDYDRLYARACQRAHVAVDAADDGVAEEIRTAGSIRLRRG